MPVIYVYSSHGASKYKFVETCPETDEPVFSIPIGPPIKSINNRYVLLVSKKCYIMSANTLQFKILFPGICKFNKIKCDATG